MITGDRALQIAREELADDIKKGGIATLLGYADHWRANCTFPDGSLPAGHVRKVIRIDLSTGDVTTL